MPAGGAPTVARRCGPVAVAALVAVLVALPLLRLGQVLWQESDGDLAAVARLRRPRDGGAQHPRPRRRGHPGRRAARDRRWRWSSGDPDLPGRAVLAGRRPAAGRRAGLRPGLQLDPGVRARPGSPTPLLGLHWAGLLGPGRRLARPGRRTPRRWSTSSSPSGWPPGPSRTSSGPRGSPAPAAATRAGHDHPPAAAARGRGRRRARLRADPGHLRDPAGARRARRVQHGDHPDLRRPLHRRRPGLLPRGGRPSPCCSSSSRPSAWRRPTRCSAPGCAPPGRPTRRRRGRCPDGAAVRRGAGRSAWPATSLLTTALPLAALALSSVTRAARGAADAGQLDASTTSGRCSPRAPLEALGRSLGLAVVAASLLVVLGGAGRGRRAAPRRAGDGDADHADPRAARLDARGRPADHLRPLAVGHADR